MTPAGFRRLNSELAQLWKVERPAMVATVAWAAGNGDRSENGDYIYGKRRLRRSTGASGSCPGHSIPPWSSTTRDGRRTGCSSGHGHVHERHRRGAPGHHCRHRRTRFGRRTDLVAVAARERAAEGTGRPGRDRTNAARPRARGGGGYPVRHVLSRFENRLGPFYQCFTRGGEMLGRRAAALVCLSLLCAAGADSELRAQVGAGTLAGRVSDSGGAAMPGVSVTVNAVATGRMRSVVSGADGRYSVPGLAPGAYDVRVALSGFRPSNPRRQHRHRRDGPSRCGAGGWRRVRSRHRHR